VKRLHQVVLIASVLLGSWLGMQAIHELGHVVGAWLTGSRVAKLVLYPLTISRTDLAENPHPLLVVWAGPVIGVLLPLAIWGVAAAARMPGHFVVRFFAGFCLAANGAYIAGGSFDAVGDCGQMLRHGSSLWQLWLFGAVSIPSGVLLWHGQGKQFGLGKPAAEVQPGVAYGTLLACILLAVLGFMIDGE
jgi:hypothetical protein